MHPTRREVMSLAAAGSVGLALSPRAAAQGPASPSPAPSAAPSQAERAARPLRILILGGTGFTGPHQVRYALARGHKVTLFNRGRRPQDWPAEVEELVGDRNTGDLASLKGREWDVCIDNPTTLPFWVRDAGQVLKGKVKQYIFISTISVYAAEKDVNADETAAVAKYAGADPMKETQESMRANMATLYGQLKARSEQECEVWFPGTTTIIRPGLIVGPGDESDRFTYWPVRLAKGGDVLAPGDGSDPVQVIDARDLAEWTIRMAEQRTFGVFNATGPSYEMTMEEMLHGIKATTTAGARLHWVASNFLEAQKVAPWGDMPTWVPADDENKGFSRRSIRRALDAGLTFRPLAVTTLDLMTWFHALPEARQAALKAGIKPDREAQVLAAWKARK